MSVPIVKKNDIRDAWQSEAEEAWNQAGGRGTVEAGTGTGKTYLGVRIIRTVTEKVGTMAIHVVVPTRILKTQWEEILAEKLDDNVDVEVFVINTYVKGVKVCDLLILDRILSS